MIESLFFALWFFWPAGSANSAPILANNIPYLRKHNTPLDFGKSFRGKRIFGTHKTWRGLGAGVANGAIIGFVQWLLASNIAWFADLTDKIDYTNPNVIIFGAVLGFGALAGDAIKSFFKRQIGVPSGESWFPFDQTDFIIGGLLISIPFANLDVSTYITIFIVYALLHPVANIVGWLLHLKPRPF